MMSSSSSSSSSNPKWVYDVFLNFRGGDTRSSFISHLHSALSNAGIKTFIDHKLHKGTNLKPELLQAIEGSQIALVVFSQNYTQSAWCLMELEKIMECHRTYGQVVVPIFYDIDPSVVRRQRGDFGKAMEAVAVRRFSGKRLLDSLVRWNDVLTKASFFTGWGMRECSDEAEQVKKIVNDVLVKLDNILLSITEFPVGLNPRVQQLIRFTENKSTENKSNSVFMVGIWGMGGSGKTTIAKAVFNQTRHKFVDKSFIENIREVCEQGNGGQIHLQEQLLFDILKTKIKIHSIAMGTTIIEKMLSGKRALIVLDDVNKFEQLNALCGNRNWMGSGSLLIVTTRDVRLLNLLKVDYIYKLREMNENDSLELLSWHAFRKESPTEDFFVLSRNVVAYCGGLPLALEVLGSYLYGRTQKEWKSVLSKLKMIPNDQVQKKLRISFDGLEDEMEKDIFLDICCFFIGKDRADVTEILNGCGLHADIGITVLVERGLLKVEKNNKLAMHDLIRDMGREIIRQSSPAEPEKRSRLWVHEDVHDVLTEYTGTKAIEGLALKLQRTSRLCFKTDAFEKLKKLRLLQLYHVRLAGDYGYLPKLLRWVCWQGFPLKYIPDNFFQGNVVAIDLKHSNLKLVWKEPRLLERLKVLNLSHSRYLINTPDFSKLPNLEKLILKGCRSLSNVHESIGDLNNLLVVNLKNCTSLSILPRMIYKLKSLKTLILSGCSKIDKLEEDIIQMESLTTLIANYTSVKQVPFSIIRSKSIGYISLCGYEGLACDVFPSLIWSWMLPTTNLGSYIQPFGSTSTSLTSMDIQDSSLGGLLLMLSGLSNLRSIWVQYDSEFQLIQELRRILDDLCDINFTKLEGTSPALQISKNSMGSHLIGMGSYHQVIKTLSKSISEGLTISGSSDFFLPGDNYPYWLACFGEGHSVHLQVPEGSDCPVNGMTLCVIYSSTPENMLVEFPTSVLIVNHTKCTIQICKQDSTMSFDEEDWKGIISNLEPGDNVEIFVALGHGLSIKQIAVYLIYDQSFTVKMESSSNVETEPSPYRKIKEKYLKKTYKENGRKVLLVPKMSFHNI